MSDSVTLTLSADGTARVTLNRPEVQNALDGPTVARLTELFTELTGRGDIRCVVLAGAGASFSAGPDLAWLERLRDFTEGLAAQFEHRHPAWDPTRH